MVKFDSEEGFWKFWNDNAGQFSPDVGVSRNGQIIIYTSMFRWNDGTVRSEPDPTWRDE